MWYWKKGISIVLIVILTAIVAVSVPRNGQAADQGASADHGQGFPIRGPVLFSTPEMLDTAKQRIAAKQEPFYTAWQTIKSRSEGALNQSSLIPYQGEEYLTYYYTGRDQSFVARDLGLMFALTDDERYSDKARSLMLDWARDAAIHTNPAGSKPIDQGLVIARVMTVFAYAYSFIYDTLSEEDIVEIEVWFRDMAELIMKSRNVWEDNDYHGQPFNNHLGAHTMGLAAIGYALNDMKLIRYALDSPHNPKNARELIEGVILMPGDELYPGDPSYFGAPDAQPGEIYDRYRSKYNNGLHYSMLHLRFITLLAEMAYNNKSGLDLYRYVGRNGETLEKAYEFYADFFITADSTIKGGYYAAENVDLFDLSMFEMAHRHYPDNEKIKQVLEARYRIVNDIQTFGYSLVLTHGMDDVVSLPADPGLGILAWEFEQDGSLGGWKVRKNMSGVVSGGAWNLTITGIDPSVISPPNLGIDAEKYKVLRIGMKNNTSDNAAQIFFITNTDVSYGGGKSIYFPIQPYDDGFTEYVVPVGNNANWKDTIAQIRFDVVNSVESGTVEIDYIRITEE